MQKRAHSTAIGPSDAEIIQEVLLGNVDLFGVLFDRYAKKVFGYLWHFSRGRHDCEDFLQDTFYKAYMNLKYCREREKFSSWLFSIAHNVAVSSAKKLSVRDAKELSIDNAFTVKDIASTDDLNVNFARAENKAILQRAIEEMPPKYKEATILFYYEDFSLKEISDILGVPPNTVKTRLHRGREYLGARLREPPGEENGADFSFAKTNTS